LGTFYLPITKREELKGIPHLSSFYTNHRDLGFMTKRVLRGLAKGESQKTDI
jgi:hypothetical protein